MSQRELYEWYDYYSQEPFLADRIEIQLATLSFIASNFAGGKSSHDDFMVTKKEKPKPKQKDLEDKLKNMFEGLGKIN